MVEKHVLVNFPPFSTHLFLLCKVNSLFLLCAKLTDCFFMLQKNIFCLHFATLRDYFFSVQNEHTISSLCKVNRLVSSLQKGKMFFYCSANLRDYLFILKSKQIGFFTAESEDILFPQCQFNRLFLYCRK